MTFNKVLLLTLIVTTLGCNAEGIETSQEDRIIGGQDVTEQNGVYPYAVSLQEARQTDTPIWDIFCNGVIIDSQWVLTTASCFDIKDVNNRRIRALAGVVDHVTVDQPANKGGAQTIMVIEIYKHPRYLGYENDIALLYLDQPFNFNQYVLPVPLPDAPLNTSERVQIMGWGQQDDPRVTHTVGARFLRVTWVDIKPYSECNGTATRSDECDFNSVLCVGELGNTACQFDGGSALEGPNRVLHGLASIYDGRCDRPAVYTAVYPFVDTFIKPAMENREILKNNQKDLETSWIFEKTIDLALFAVSIHSKPKMNLNIREQLCTGTLLSKRWVVTAAHCLDLDRSDRTELFIVAGISTVYPTYEELFLAEIRPVQEVFVHPDYKRSEINNDIALLYLNGDLTDAQNYALELPPNGDYRPREVNYINTAGFITKFGYPYDIYTNKHIQVTNATLQPSEECVNYYPQVESEMVHCATRTTEPVSCHTNTGGALFEFNSRILLGVGSLKKTPCGKYPETYVRVAKHLDFLKSTMNSR